MDSPRKHDEPHPKGPPIGSTVRDLVIAAGLLALFAAFFARGGRLSPKQPPRAHLVELKPVSEASREICGEVPNHGPPVVIEMAYSSDKQAWIEEAADRFAKLCAGIQVKTVAIEGGIAGADVILSGELKPTLWSPADDLVLRYFDHRWSEIHGRAAFDIAKQVPLVRSPLVLLIWEERLRVLDSIREKQKAGEGLWMDALCAGVPRDPQNVEAIVLEDRVPGAWIDWYAPTDRASATRRPPVVARRAEKKERPAYQAPFPTDDEIIRWGQTKFVHASPTKATEGLEALYLMAYDYALPPSDRPAALEGRIEEAMGQPATEGVIVRGDLAEEDFARWFGQRREPFQRWLGRCEAGLPPPLPSAVLLTDAIFDVGSSRYDAVVTQEHLVFPMFERIDTHADVLATLRVVYPRPTILNEHPVVVFEDGRITVEQRTAAERWLNFLRSAEIQTLAVARGFRPVSPDLKIRDIEGSLNPFLQFRRYGVEIATPIVEAPRLDGGFVHDLVRAWQNATGRH